VIISGAFGAQGFSSHGNSHMAKRSGTLQTDKERKRERERWVY